MLTDLLNQTLSNNTVGEWLVSLAIAFGSIVVARLFYLVSTKGLKRVAQKAKGRLLYILADMLEEPISLGLVIGGLFWAERSLDFAKATDEVFSKVLTFAVILDVTWAIARLLDNLVDAYLVPRVEKSESKLDDQLLPIIRKGSNVVIWLLGAVTAISDAGYNVGTIVAGLGIGGLAFAFAAQETIANLFGGVAVFVDSPFRMNDRIKIGGYDGWVREIGLRTAKLETLDGRRLTIPNSMFTKSVIENVSSEPATRVVQTVRVDRAGGAEAAEKALAALRRVIETVEEIEGNSTAFLAEIGEWSYDLTLVSWIKKDADYAAARSAINLAVLKAFEEAGIKLANPTRVLVAEGKTRKKL